MKILLITDNLGSGGVQRQIVNISNYLAENNEITISVYDNKNNFFKNKLSDKISYIYPKKNINRNYFKLIFWIIKNIKVNYDCILSFQPSMNIMVTLINLIYKKKHINVEMSISHPEENKLKRALTNFSNYICGNVICNSFHHQEYINSQKLCPKKNKVIWNGYEIISKNNQKKSFKRTLNLLVIGRVSYPKNGLRIIQALRYFYARNGFMPILSWVGRNDKSQKSIELQKKMINYINKYSILKSNIKFLGEVPESKMNNLFFSSDALLSASIYEGLPNVICEAMIRKLPVIVSKVSDNYRLIGNEERGFLCDPFDPFSICQSIEKFYSINSQDKKILVENAFKFASEKFSIKEISSQYIATIKDIT